MASVMNHPQRKTLVYNKSFNDRNFGTEQIPSVFTLGEAIKEEIEFIEYRRKTLEEIKAKGVQKKITIESQQKALNVRRLKDSI